jgi:hypothetical protein
MGGTMIEGKDLKQLFEGARESIKNALGRVLSKLKENG